MEVAAAGPVLGSKEAGVQPTITSDFETFLRMLTTQIQNQDPLSPMEADQFASQLATFSMVEQQTLTNQNLEELISSISAGGLPGYASLVGRVAVHDQAFQFSGTPVELEIKNEISSSDTKIVILDRSGNVVAEIGLGSGQFKATWDGTGLDGRLLPPALYSAEVWRVSDDFHTETTVTTQAVIEEVRFDGGEATLILSDGTEIAEDRVKSVR